MTIDDRNFTPEQICPICKTDIRQKYCSNCGLPWISEPSITDYQECICHTINPTDAKFCRNCGKDLSLQAIDKNGHIWVDLGLSVLWSSEAMDGIYRWMDSKKYTDIYDYNKRRPISQPDRIGDGKDVASLNWGEKWRIPTRAEFEELVEKCQWEKAVIPESNKRALKITGPNGNYIYFSSSHYWISAKKHITSDYLRYWTSTKHITGNKGYCFIYHEKMGKYDWLKTPINKKLLNTPLAEIGHQESDMIKYASIIPCFWEAIPIRPVADKKWKGKM